MHEQFESRNLLRSFKDYLDRQKKEDPHKCYWHDDSNFRPGDSGIQIRCEGLHSFLARPEEIFNYFNKKDLIAELDCLYDLIVKKKHGFTAPCYEFSVELRQKGFDPPEFIDTVKMCLSTISGLAFALSAKGALDPKSKEKVSDMLGKALNWLNSSWSPGPPKIEGEEKGIGWGGFKMPGEISVYATWAVVSVLPKIKDIFGSLDNKRQKAASELFKYAKNVELWLQDFSNRQIGHWEAGEWESPEEGIIYNIYGLSAVASFMLYFPQDYVRSTLKDEEYKEFIRDLIQGVLHHWERAEYLFASTEIIDVGVTVNGKWQSIKYDDCSIVPNALYAISVICSNFEEELKSMTRTDKEKEGEVIYDSMERAAQKMLKYIYNHYWDVERAVVIKPVSGYRERSFCIYMTDRVVCALAAYENWKEKPEDWPTEEGVETHTLLKELKILKSEVQGIRQDLGNELKDLSRDIKMIPGKVLKKLEEQQKDEKDQDQFE